MGQFLPATRELGAAAFPPGHSVAQSHERRGRSCSISAPRTTSSGAASPRRSSTSAPSRRSARRCCGKRIRDLLRKFRRGEASANAGRNRAPGGRSSGEGEVMAIPLQYWSRTRDVRRRAQGPLMLASFSVSPPRVRSPSAAASQAPAAAPQPAAPPPAEPAAAAAAAPAPSAAPAPQPSAPRCRPRHLGRAPRGSSSGADLRQRPRRRHRSGGRRSRHPPQRQNRSRRRHRNFARSRSLPEPR